MRKLVWVQPWVLGTLLVVPSAFLKDFLLVFGELNTNLVIIMTIHALTRSIFQLRRISHSGEGVERPAKSSLRLAWHTTMLQLTFVFLDFLIRISVVAFSAEFTIVTAWRELVKAVLLLLMSGSHRVTNADSQNTQMHGCNTLQELEANMLPVMSRKVQCSACKGK